MNLPCKSSILAVSYRYASDTMTLHTLLDTLPAEARILATVLAILVAGLFLGAMAHRAVKAALGKTKLAGLAASFLGRAARIAVYVVTVVSALGTAGVDTTSLLAALGAAGLAIGLALRDTLSNLAAGLILAFNGAFKQGDTIEVSGIIGTVMEIDLLTTELKTPDARKAVLPNGQLMQSSVINYSTYPARRIEFVVGVSYEDDVAVAEHIILEVIANASFCHSDPAPVVGADALGDFGQNILIRVWVEADEVVTGKMKLLAAIKKAFDDKGITIPFPRYEVSNLPG